MRKLVAALALFLGLASAALAQVVNNPTLTAPAGAYNSSAPTCTDGKFCRLQTDINGQLKVAASVSASIAGFAPAGTYANLTATNASADVALPVGAVVIAYNTGTTAVSCNLTVGAGTAVANKDQIQASSWIAYTVGSNTHASCIDQAGSASNVVVLSGGSGIPTGAGGGGGGGGAITAAASSYSAGAFSAGTGVDGWDLTLGAKADAACSTDIATCTLIALIKLANQHLTDLNATAGASIPAGTNLIGNTGIDQSTPGTTNNVAVSYGASALVDNPCQTVAKTYAPISITTNTTTRIVAPTSAKKTYVCSIVLQTALANNVGVVEGTGGTCGTGTAGVLGGTTAASGLNLAANEGYSAGNGASAILATAGTNVDLCLITSVATNLAGHVSWVQK